MKSFTLITASLICGLSLISVSTLECHTVGVKPGEEVTLMCSNISSAPTTTNWFKVFNRTKPSCVSSLYRSVDKPSYCDGFKDGRFNMSSSNSTVFLQINRVGFSDSGLYFCGFYQYPHEVISEATYLNVEGDSKSGDEVASDIEKEPEEKTNLVTLMLAALTVLLTVIIIILALIIGKLKTAANEELQPERNKGHALDDLNYAALSFQKKPKRASRPALDREMEPHVVYAATR